MSGLTYLATLPAGTTVLEMINFNGAPYLLTNKGLFTLDGSGRVVEVGPSDKPQTVDVWQPRVFPAGHWFTWSSVAPRELSESDKAIHRAISIAESDGKRYGTRYVGGEDEPV